MTDMNDSTDPTVTDPTSDNPYDDTDLPPVLTPRPTTTVKVESIGAPNADGIVSVTAKGVLPQPGKIGGFEAVFKVPATFRIELPAAQANTLTLGGDYEVEL